MYNVTMKIHEKILKNKSINSTDKLVYGVIGALSKKHGHCFAYNDYISNTLNISARTISKSINKLKKQNYIKVTDEKDKRIIYMVSMEENV